MGALEYVEGTDELYTGKSETHYENGNLQHSGQYENGLMEGVWNYFYEDGQLYLNMTYKQGIMNGLTETFYENGSLYLKGNSKDGKRDGLWTTFKNSEFIKDAPLTKNGQKGYKKSHVNHPCAKWLRQSTKNYEWLCKLGIELCKEYTYRYERVHSTQQHIEWLSRITPNIDDNGFTIPLLAMPNEYKCDNVIKSYKTYYIKDKKRFAKWTKRNIPKWFIELDDL